MSSKTMVLFYHFCCPKIARRTYAMPTLGSTRLSIGEIDLEGAEGVQAWAAWMKAHRATMAFFSFKSQHDLRLGLVQARLALA